MLITFGEFVYAYKLTRIETSISIDAEHKETFE